MKRFNAWLNKVLTPPAVLQAATAVPQVAWEDRGGHFDCLMRFPAHFGYIPNAEAGIQLWLCAGLANQGARVYAPTLNEAQALSQVDMNVPCSVYRQPFETFTVVYPDGFSVADISPDCGKPFAATARVQEFQGRWLFALILLADGRREMQCVYNWSADSTDTIESHVFGVGAAPHHTEAESESIQQARRLLMNASLLLTQYGAKRLGTSDPTKEMELATAIRDGNRDTRRAAERDMKALPVVYGIDQDVKVYETEGFSDATGAGGWHVKPHWRRGHWAMVACGAARKDRRRVFRAAVMVNAERFAGTPSDTRATYTTNNAGAA